MSDEHADGIGGESHLLFQRIESMRRRGVSALSFVLYDAVEEGVDAQQGLTWLLEALTPEKVWESYLALQECRMEEHMDKLFPPPKKRRKLEE